MTAFRPPLKLGLIPVALFLVFGAAAALIVPTDYAIPRPTPPDEGPHVGYVIHLAQQRTLPVFLSLQDNYEGHQPPLYYLSALPAYGLYGLISGHFPTDAERGMVVALRLWSVLVAALGVWLAWLLGRRVFPHSRLLALSPALFLALWPGRTLMLAAVTNDGLAEAMCLGAFLLCAVSLEEGLTLRRAAWLGLAWALALMSKSTSLALGPVVLLAVLMATSRGARTDEERQQAGKRAVAALGLIAAVVAVVAGWWFVRNQILYGDPMAAEVFNRLFKTDRPTPETFLAMGLSGGQYFARVVVRTALSFWGVYGQANVWNPGWYYLLGALMWLGMLVGPVRQRFMPVEEETPVEPVEPPPGLKKPNKHRAAPDAPEPPAPRDWRHQLWMLAWILLVVVIVLFLRFNSEFYQGQARYLFAANGPIALLSVLGLWDLDRRRAGRWAVIALLAVLLFMSVWSVFGYGPLVAAEYPKPIFRIM